MTESQIDREMSAIIGRCVRGEALPDDRINLSLLQMRRAQMMTPPRPKRRR